jgi:hypothetical protein
MTQIARFIARWGCALTLLAGCGPLPPEGPPGSPPGGMQGGGMQGGGMQGGGMQGGGMQGGGGCPLAKNFPPVSAAPENAAYPAPTLNVSCDGTTVTVQSNGIPGYRFVATTPNPLRAQNYNWRFPQNPAQAARTTTIPLLGPVGIAVNGLPFYGPNEAQMPHPYGDPVYNQLLDYCLGHTAQRGDYHYHALLVKCLVSGAADGKPSPIIGYAFDGFPIYGPYGCVDAACTRVVKFQSGWDRVGDPRTYAWNAHRYTQKSGETYLDQCNGHVGPDGTYHYHATDTFPYILGCYRGTAMANGGGPMGM